MDRAAPEVAAPTLVQRKQTYATQLRERAVDDLTFRLQEGKTVAGVSWIELFYDELQSNAFLRDEIDTLFCADGGNDTFEGYGRRLRDGIIERFLSTRRGEDAIDAEIQRQKDADEEPDEMDLSRAARDADL